MDVKGRKGGRKSKAKLAAKKEKIREAKGTAGHWIEHGTQI